MSAQEKAPGPRWWPAWIIVGLTLTAVGVIQFTGDTPQQARNMHCYISVAVGLAALLGWLLFYSRMRVWIRIATLGGLGFFALLAAVALLWAMLRISHHHHHHHSRPSPPHSSRSFRRHKAKNAPVVPH